MSEFESEKKEYFARSKVFLTESIKLLGDTDLKDKGYFYLSEKIINPVLDSPAIRQDFNENLSSDVVLEELNKKWADSNSRIEGKLVYEPKKISLSIIKSVSDFLVFVKDFKKKNLKTSSDTTLYYRGHNTFDFKLVPSLYRNANFKKNETNMKGDTLQMFPELRKESSEINLMAHFQHNGLPTKLLDITSNPLVALFFACFADANTKSKNEDGRLFIFVVENEKLLNPEEADKALQISSKMPVPLYVKSDAVNDRLKPQAGAFILFPNNNEIEDELTKNKQVLLIPAEQKEEILKELRILGIDEYFIYPEFEHFCKALRQKYS